jgi:hypothetical protein
MFRALAADLAEGRPRDWQWTGPHDSQRMFGITEERAKEYARLHGGEARQMIEVVVERPASGLVDRVLLPGPTEVADFILGAAEAQDAEHEETAND